MQPDESSPRKKVVQRDLSATVPDIFASIAADHAATSEFTLMKLSGSGQLKFPGTWQELEKQAKQPSSLSFRRKDSISAVVSIGPLLIEKPGEILIRSLCVNEARALQDSELAGVLDALADRRRPDQYDVMAGSIEMLGDKTVLVIQGFFKKTALKEALIVFPDSDGYRQLSLQAIKPEFPVYFNHLRQALQTIEWL